jgi:hypothetical protein
VRREGHGVDAEAAVRHGTVQLHFAHAGFESVLALDDVVDAIDAFAIVSAVTESLTW